jgi:hypothetical protein
MRPDGLGLSARPRSAVRLSGAALPPWVKRGFADQSKSARIAPVLAFAFAVRMASGDPLPHDLLNFFEHWRG